MNTDIIILCPSRGRNDKHLALVASYLATSPRRSRLVFGLDDDDQASYLRYRHPRISYEVGPHAGCTAALNRLAKRHAPRCRLLGMLGDDAAFRSRDWERQVLAAHKTGGVVIYGDDKLTGEKLCTLPFVDSRIPRALGCWAPATMRHLFTDDFLMAVGRGLGRLRYLPGLVIEHLHPLAGKAPMDATYAETNNPEAWRRDAMAFDKYLATRYQTDLRKIKRTLRCSASPFVPRFVLRPNPPILPSPSEVVESDKPLTDLSTVRLFIGTPCMGGTNATGYTASFSELRDTCRALGIGFIGKLPNGDSLIPRARSRMVCDFLASDATHLLWMDSDQGFRAQDVVDMLRLDLRVVAAVVPKGTINWEQVAARTTQGNFTAADLEEAGLEYVVTHIRGGATLRGCIEVLDAGTGYMLLKRSTIEAVISAHPETEYEDDSPQTRGRKTWHIFPANVVNRRLLSEDFYFCRWWQELGGKVWIYPNAVCHHIKPYVFRGDYSRRVRVQPTQPDKEKQA